MTGTAAPEREAPEVVCAGVAKTFPTPAGPLAALDTVEVTLAPGSVHQKLVWLGYTGSERTTRRAVAAAKAAFRVGNRRVHRPWVTEPGMWVSDFTYVRSWAGFVYTAFIVDVFAQRILAWHCATTKHVELVATPLRIALWDRDRQGHTVGPDELICHSDAGSQYTAIRFTEHLALEGISPSIGSVGDAYDNALMETINGLYKAECIRTTVFHDGPYKTIADVEYATAGWVDWYNQRRVHSTLGYLTPAEYEDAHYAALNQELLPT